MLSSGRIGVSSWRYYSDQVSRGACGYYLDGGEAPGRWYGRGLSELNLPARGIVSERYLEALFARGLHPTSGSQLGRAWRADGVTGWDLCFSAPKSVSALWALGDPDVAGQVLSAHRAAVRAALDYLDDHAALSRVGTNGTRQVGTAGLVAALFPHRTSRAGDPQLHTHALVLNKVRCPDGRWRTLDGHEVFAHKKAAGALYQAGLRAELAHRLGIEFGPVSQHGQADILGIPTELRSCWSKRATAISVDAAPVLEAAEEQLGRPLLPAERARIIKTSVLATRPNKHVEPEPQLRDRWTSEAQQLGWTPERLLNQVRDTAREAGDARAAREAAKTNQRITWVGPPGLSPAETAVLETGSRLAVFSAADLTVSVAAYLPSTAASTASGVRELVEAGTQAALGTEMTVRLPDHREVLEPDHASITVTEASDPVVSTGEQSRGITAKDDPIRDVPDYVPDPVLRDVPSQSNLAAVAPPGAVEQGSRLRRVSDARFASAHTLELEQDILDLAHTGQGLGMMIADRNLLALRAIQARLDVSQKKALEHACRSGDAVSVIVAPAGTGKTTALGVAAQVWAYRGWHTVIGLAPTARAAAELSAATGQPAFTVAHWLLTHQPTTSAGSGSSAGSSERGERADVLLVDEAGMLSTQDLHTLLTSAARIGTKVVLVGDPMQLGSINSAGGMLQVLADRLHAPTLESPHRFRDPWERQATLRLRVGDQSVLAEYEEHGRIHPAEDEDAAIGALFAQYQAETAAGREVLMLARTRADVDTLNTLARTAALSSGEITGPVLHTAGGQEWQAGDQLITTRNNRQLPAGDSHVRNGDRYTVLGPTPTGGLRLQPHRPAPRPGVDVASTTAGDQVVELPGAYVTAHTRYGWASSIDTAQGATVDTSLLLARPGLDREHLYVALTRGRHTNHIHLTGTATEVEPHHESLGCNRPNGTQAAIVQLSEVLERTQRPRAASDQLSLVAYRSSRPPVPNPDRCLERVTTRASRMPHRWDPARHMPIERWARTSWHSPHVETERPGHSIDW